MDEIRAGFERFALRVLSEHQALGGPDGDDRCVCTARGCAWAGPRSGPDGHGAHVVSVLTADKTYTMPLVALVAIANKTLDIADELGVDTAAAGGVVGEFVERVGHLRSIAAKCQCGAADATILGGEFGRPRADT